MSINELETKCRRLQELKDFEMEVKTEIAAMENEIKALMQERNTEELTAGQSFAGLLFLSIASIPRPSRKPCRTCTTPT